MPNDRSEPELSVSDRERQAFEQAAEKYRAHPTEQNFHALVAAKAARDDRAHVAAVVYEVAGRNAFQLPTISHLARALAMEDRLQEASYFCNAWLGKAPSSTDALRLSCLLSCKRMDLAAARDFFSRLQQAKAAEGLLWAMETLMLLSFSNSANATDTARSMLESSSRDAIAPWIAAEAAYRHEDARLLMLALEADPELANESPQRLSQGRSMILALLVQILQLRHAWKE